VRRREQRRAKLRAARWAEPLGAAGREQARLFERLARGGAEKRRRFVVESRRAGGDEGSEIVTFSLSASTSTSLINAHMAR